MVIRLRRVGPPRVRGHGHAKREPVDASQYASLRPNPIIMASHRLHRNDCSATKQRALDDAKRMQVFVIESCKKLNKEIPPYQFFELIGKGSYGRVYKAKSLVSGKHVAIKTIDIEQGDMTNPRMADTYSDLMKEINALKLLGESNAKNINHVIEALSVGQSMWVVTEYCAGGSVSTLMRPNAPAGLHERWIIPILREVSEALSWVHAQGIIHRDLKGANVLIAEDGAVQLADFGVAGVIATKFDKRTTVIGTPHWMAPELFDESASYGTEIDIWAFGAMAYEIAVGQPPNVAFGMDLGRLGTHIKHHNPRLDGDQYSAGLKDIIAFCLQGNAIERPNIRQIQAHSYISKTEQDFPSSSLSRLVRAYKLWESAGGDRRSLFSAGGAQGPVDQPTTTAIFAEDWDFGAAAFEEQDSGGGDSQEVCEVYGSDVEYNQEPVASTSPGKRKNRRRPPRQLPTAKAPLEKLFDPNTLSTYDDNSRQYYARFQLAPINDLPLRDEAASAGNVRESLIDLDASLDGGELSHFVDLSTIRPRGSSLAANHEVHESLYHPDLSTEPDPRRRTQEWKFPLVAAPSSATMETLPSAFDTDSGATTLSQESFFLPLQFSPPLTDLIDMSEGHFVPNLRQSVVSLIDLDLSLTEPSPDTRPSTSHSLSSSMAGSDAPSRSPFDLETHSSEYAAPAHPPDESSSQDKKHVKQPLPFEAGRSYSLSDFADSDPEISPPTQNSGVRSDLGPDPGRRVDTVPSGHSIELSSGLLLPKLPDAPAPYVLLGQATQDDVKNELRRMTTSLGEHLRSIDGLLTGLAKL